MGGAKSRDSPAKSDLDPLAKALGRSVEELARVELHRGAIYVGEASLRRDGIETKC